jgi:hypothetical protein
LDITGRKGREAGEDRAMTRFKIPAIRVIKEDEMGGTCSTHGRDEKYILYFGWETSRKEITWKT